jgi:arsenate reductase
MGEGLFRYYLGNRFEVYSAGTKPTSVRPEAIAVMAELGIDIRGHWSKSVNEFLNRDFAFIVTVCEDARKTCPYFPGMAQRLRWSFEDPAAVEGSEQLRLDAFRRIRDQIREQVAAFAATVT